MTDHLPLTAKPFRTQARLATWIVTVLVVGVGLALGPSPSDFVSIAPGPTPSASELITVEGTVYAPQGSFHITTALVSAPNSLSYLSLLEAGLDPHKQLLFEESVYPPQLSRKESDTLHAQQMTLSQEAATFAALGELGMLHPDGALVREVRKDAPSSGKLKPGDIITAVDGQPVTEARHVTPLIESRPPGAPVALTILREGSRHELSIETIESPDKEGKAAVGIFISTHAPLPVDIRFDSDEIGGPSAGLIFALTIFDLLDPADLTKGQVIAGTGTITPEGEVGAVGAVAQKIEGARKQGAKIFLVPAGELSQAEGPAAKAGLELVGVSTLRQAIEELRKRG